MLSRAFGRTIHEARGQNKLQWLQSLIQEPGYPAPVGLP